MDSHTKDVLNGAAAGAASGTVRGLAKCAPALWGPINYAKCLKSEAIIGATAGVAAAGTIKTLNNNYQKN